MKYQLYQKYISEDWCEKTNNYFIDYYIGSYDDKLYFFYFNDGENNQYIEISKIEHFISFDDNFFNFLKKLNLTMDGEYIYGCKLLTLAEEHNHKICLEDKLKNILKR